MADGRKLELHKETLRGLNDADLAEVAGGDGTMLSCAVCDPTGPSFFSCHATCHTFYTCWVTSSAC